MPAGNWTVTIFGSHESKPNPIDPIRSASPPVHEEPGSPDLYFGRAAADAFDAICRPGGRYHRRRSVSSRTCLPAFLGADVRLRPRDPEPSRQLSAGYARSKADHRLSLRSLSRHLSPRSLHLRRGRPWATRLQLLLPRSKLRRIARQRGTALRRTELHAQKLASKDTLHAFWYKQNIAPPKDYAK